MKFAPALFALLASSAALAQPASEAGRFRTEPFDLAVDHLPPKFSGYDCSAIAKRLKALNTSKDEFESTAAHAMRVDPLLAQKLSGSITGNDPMVFVAEVKSWNVRYDAEAELLSLSLSFSPNVLNSDKKEGLVVGEVATKLGTTSESYVGTNSYGARAKVTAFTQTVCGVGFKNLGYSKAILHPYKFEVRADGATARELKERLSVALVGVLVNPYYGTYVAGTTATIKSPQSLSVHGDAVMMRLDEVWLFDRTTGRILGKAATPAKL